MPFNAPLRRIQNLEKFILKKVSRTISNKKRRKNLLLVFATILSIQTTIKSFVLKAKYIIGENVTLQYCSVVVVLSVLMKLKNIDQRRSIYYYYLQYVLKTRNENLYQSRLNPIPFFDRRALLKTEQNRFVRKYCAFWLSF